MISATVWVRRGAAKQQPDRNELSPEELDALVKQSEQMNIQEGDEGDEGDDEDKDIQVPEQEETNEGEDAFLKELRMDEYDEEEDAGAELFLGGKQLTVFGGNEEDPYMTIPDHEDESDEEDTDIRPDDSVILVGKTEEEHSVVEVHVYNQEKGELYVHHDFALPSFPLSMAWMDHDPRSGAQGSFLAVGTFQPGIEIWNLDVLDVLEPTQTLGGRCDPDPEKIMKLKAKVKKNKKFKKQLKAALMGELKESSHSDAVMCLSWHPQHRERLASGSADGTIKLWDISTGQCTATLTHHSDKVQSIAWNPAEPSILLSGSYDKTVCVLDIRNPSAVQKFKLDADVESVCWCPVNPAIFLVSTELGTVTCHDARKVDTPLFKLSAHDKACTLAWNSVAEPAMFVTGSVDKTVKVWEIKDNKPNMVTKKKLDIGSVFSLNFEGKEGAPFVLCAGGDKGRLAVWDTMEDENVALRYGKK